MDSGVAGHVMLIGMFLRVKPERKTAQTKFVDLGENTIPFKSITFRSASIHCRKSSELETLWCWMKRIRTYGNTRDGTVIKLDVRAQWTCGLVSMEQVQFSAGRDSEWPNCFSKNMQDQ